MDEIGFLESASPAYQAELLRLFEQKRVLAAVRRADTAFLEALCRRADCFLLDLDEIREDA